MDHPLSASVKDLAARAAELSTKLYAIQEDIDHTTTSDDISFVAAELALLSTTLWKLNEAISANPQQYTDAFNEDLAEITVELDLIFEETSECSLALQKSDGGKNAVAWLFRKGRVARLLKHLEALKTTLVVMRTVLQRNEGSGTQE